MVFERPEELPFVGLLISYAMVLLAGLGLLEVTVSLGPLAFLRRLGGRLFVDKPWLVPDRAREQDPR